MLAFAIIKKLINFFFLNISISFLLNWNLIFTFCELHKERREYEQRIKLFYLKKRTAIFSFVSVQRNMYATRPSTFYIILSRNEVSIECIKLVHYMPVHSRVLRRKEKKWKEEKLCVREPRNADWNKHSFLRSYTRALILAQVFSLFRRENHAKPTLTHVISISPVLSDPSYPPSISLYTHTSRVN